jgi:hypothetical protein
MTARSVPLLAAVTANEQAVVEAAARHLASALSQATGESWTCPCNFATGLDSLTGATSGSIVVTSLLLSLTDFDKPWPEVEKELRGTYSALSEAGDPIMICTVLRHVDVSEDFEQAARIRRRLRKLNLLATELSREYGALVIDIDRVLADVGARRLNTDFRLGGAVAAEFSSKTMALCIATNALDAFAPVKVQDAARAILDGYQLSVGLGTEQMMTSVMSLGQGRRKQRVATTTDEVPENHVGWLVRQVLKGRIGGREAFGKLLGAVRRRGARESAWLLITGVSRMLRPAEAGARR